MDDQMPAPAPADATTTPATGDAAPLLPILDAAPLAKMEGPTTEQSDIADLKSTVEQLRAQIALLINEGARDAARIAALESAAGPSAVVPAKVW